MVLKSTNLKHKLFQNNNSKNIIYFVNLRKCSTSNLILQTLVMNNLLSVTSIWNHSWSPPPVPSTCQKLPPYKYHNNETMKSLKYWTLIRTFMTDLAHESNSPPSVKLPPLPAGCGGLWRQQQQQLLCVVLWVCLYHTQLSHASHVRPSAQSAVLSSSPKITAGVHRWSDGTWWWCCCCSTLGNFYLNVRVRLGQGVARRGGSQVHPIIGQYSLMICICTDLLYPDVILNVCCTFTLNFGWSEPKQKISANRSNENV